MRALAPRSRHAALVAAAVASLAAPAAVVAQTSVAPAAPVSLPATAPATATASNGRVLSLADYGGWSRITGTALSPDGRWVTYAYQPNDGDPVVHVRRLGDTLTHAVRVGASARFSDDSRWFATLVSPPEKEAEKLRKAHKPVPRAAILIDLATGRRDSVPDAASITFAEGGRWVAVQRARADTSSKARGADVVLRDLRGGTALHLGAVGQLAFNEPAKGGAATHLAYTVDAADQVGNGVYVIELASGRTIPVASGSESFDGLAWSDDGAKLAVLHGDAPEKMAHRANAILVASGFAATAPTRIEIAATAAPTGMVLSENAEPRWSRDGSRLFVGLRAQEPAVEKGDDPVANVDVWHWKDEEVQSVQIVRSAQDRRFTYAAAVIVADRKLVPLADTAMRIVAPTALGTIALGRDGTPYRGAVSWGGGRADWYAVNTATGARTPIVRDVSRTMGSSPDGRWFLYLEDGHVHAHDLVAGRTVDLSAQAGVDFVDADDDHPYERPIYGVAGWSSDGKSVLLHHRFDVWQLSLAGGRAVNLTRGAGDSAQIRFRVVRPDRPAHSGGGGGQTAADDEGIDMSKPLILAAYGEWTKQSGYWQREPNGMLRPLLYGDEMIGALARAEDGERVVFTRQTFERFPDVWSAPNLQSLARAERVTDANPQIGGYAWGKRILVDYTNAKGQRLQGTLALPANYEPGRKYPMIVYFYEKVSDRHHEFSMPVYDDRPHFSTYASDGYMVFMPDIVYEEGRPGSSALDCVTSGVRKVIELGYADPARIALQGHSWGGYQSSFIITQTDMFRTAVIGAPPADLSSMYGQLYKNTGTVNNGIFEIGQVRMGDGQNPWSAHELYESQSPVHQVQGIRTPFLILHGTADGAVDWLQGVELYTAARRFGKEVVLLSYPGENHHLARKENTKDFQLRMKQWFDHYLKDAPAPRWMTEGVPQLRKGESATVMRP
ncbi:MAG: prolyl oligopeptidase family serine peptidase [Gemmatimonadaceae bacterium]